MQDASFLAETLIFLIAAVAVAPIFQRLRSSLVLGYLVAGVIIGPAVFDLISDSEQVLHIAELGVVFLLFTIGLELNVDRLKLIRNQIFGVGTAQVVVTSLVIAMIAWAAGFSVETSIAIGGGLALSSTAVVLQLLSERGELATRRGRLVLAILLLQDLAVVPLLALVPALAGEGGGFVSLLWDARQGDAPACRWSAVLGRLVVRPVFSGDRRGSEYRTVRRRNAGCIAGDELADRHLRAVIGHWRVPRRDIVVGNRIPSSGGRRYSAVPRPATRPVLHGPSASASTSTSSPTICCWSLVSWSD